MFESMYASLRSLASKRECGISSRFLRSLVRIMLVECGFQSLKLQEQVRCFDERVYEAYNENDSAITIGSRSSPMGGVTEELRELFSDMGGYLEEDRESLNVE